MKVFGTSHGHRQVLIITMLSVTQFVCPFGRNKHCLCIAGFWCGGELDYGGALRFLLV